MIFQNICRIIHVVNPNHFDNSITISVRQPKIFWSIVELSSIIANCIWYLIIGLEPKMSKNARNT